MPNSQSWATFAEARPQERGPSLPPKMLTRTQSLPRGRDLRRLLVVRQSFLCGQTKVDEDRVTWAGTWDNARLKASCSWQSLLMVIAHDFEFIHIFTLGIEHQGPFWLPY